MRYISVCSGMEAATVAWHPLGWTPTAFSEIEPYPSALLKHKYPNIPNYGDLTKYDEWPIEPGTVDLIVGGTPCQAWSVAGKRMGLDDPRGRVALAYAGLIEKLRPKWIVWENVPGVYSAGKPGGADFAAFVGTLVKLGYHIAYRTLNAEYFGVPQRRRRCILVGYLGDWRPAAAVLFEPESLRRDIKKGRAKGQSVAAGAEGGVDAGSPIGVDFRHERFERDGTVGTIQSKSTGGYSLNYAPGVAIPYRKSKRACSTTDNETWVEAEASNTLNNFDLGDTRTTHAVVEPFAWTQNQREEVRILGDKTGALALPGTHQSNYIAEALAVTFQPGNLRRDAGADPSTTTTTLKASAGDQMPHVATAMAVRRLTPIECERLQGFPDNWSRISWKGKPEEECPDGPRYRACGNSMAVPVMAWIGERIAQADAKHFSHA